MQHLTNALFDSLLQPRQLSNPTTPTDFQPGTRTATNLTPCIQANTPCEPYPSNTLLTPPHFNSKQEHNTNWLALSNMNWQPAPASINQQSTAMTNNAMPRISSCAYTTTKFVPSPSPHPCPLADSWIPLAPTPSPLRPPPLTNIHHLPAHSKPTPNRPTFNAWCQTHASLLQAINHLTKHRTLATLLQCTTTHTTVYIHALASFPTLTIKIDEEFR